MKALSTKAALFLLIASLATFAPAQTFQVIHTFTGQNDGGNPHTGLTLDRGGNLYGTAWMPANGEVFKVMHQGSGWTLQVLHKFEVSEGSLPFSPVAFGPDGALYGTNYAGGNMQNGTVYVLRPPRAVCRTVFCPWPATTLYAFTGGPDSMAPQGHLTFDLAGNIYGTAFGYEESDSPGFTGYQYGSVWELVRSGVSYSMNVLYGFSTTPGEGQNPSGGVTFDGAGNLYGTTVFGGGSGLGTVFELSPSGAGWSYQTLHSFNSQGVTPEAGLIVDQGGKMYGATFAPGYAFELSPSGNGWSFTTLSELAGADGPNSDLTMDAEGNLYGANYNGGLHNQGSIFKLFQSNGTWSYLDLYDFTGGADGSFPNGTVVIDANGNIYGTASQGGEGYGTVWEMTP